MGEVIGVVEFLWNQLYSLGIDRDGFNMYFEADLKLKHDLNERTARAVRMLFETLEWTKAHPKALESRQMVEDYKRAKDAWSLRRSDRTYVKERDRLTPSQRVAIEGTRSDAFQRVLGRFYPLTTG